jgi:hypothetical protein
MPTASVIRERIRTVIVIATHSIVKDLPALDL